ncbi:FAD-dependent oxidoreductase [Azospirillum rugosum]|nr:FAD-dependent oxidoreductase [Azospirillum rugosum]
MILDGAELPEDAVIDTEICVVGAGAAGITLGKAFDALPFRVTILEAGSYHYSRAGQKFYAGSTSGMPYLPPSTARLRYFGGSTNRWAGLCRPLDPIDFERRDWIPGSGWPFSEAELRPYYARAADLIGLPTDRFDGDYWSGLTDRPLLPLCPQRFINGATQIKPTRFGTAHRDALSSSRNVTCFLNSSVVDLRVGDTDNVVREVVVATPAGRRFRVRARVVVLACGGLENARLLLNADDVRPAGLGNGHGNVGRYFMEHRVSWPGIVRLSGPDPRLWFYTRHAAPGVAMGTMMVEGCVRPTADLMRRERILNTHFALEPFSKGPTRGSRSLGVLRDGLGQWLRGGDMVADVDYHLGNILRDLDWLTENKLRKFLGIDKSSTTWLIKAEVEQAPNPASRVTLVHDVDALGLRRINLHWQMSAIDEHSVRRGIELFGEELERLNVGTATVSMLTGNDGWSRFDHWGHHHCGTTRISERPQDGVVDPDCRVHELDNLYIAGNSVFPTEGTATPTFTMIALTLRLADHLTGVLAR